MEIQKNVPLKKYTSFQIGGPAEYFFDASTKEDLVEAIRFARTKGLALLILGGGSNVLIPDEGRKGMVVRVNNNVIEVDGENIIVGAGTPLRSVVKEALDNGLSGLEWAAGIPGTLGGAVRGNAGAFGGQTADAVSEVEAYDVQKGEVVTLSNNECDFSYRTSIFKTNTDLVVLSAKLKLKRDDKGEIEKNMESHLQYRKERHPKEPSAGSFFKNVSVSDLPSDFFEKFPKAKEAVKEDVLPAAFLIHDCGLKGERIGSIQVSELHPNFLINISSGTAKEVLELMEMIKKKVKEKYGINLQEEIKILDRAS